ncbi:hypothetical protein ACJW31_04G122600 [Castanea mollissima]
MAKRSFTRYVEQELGKFPHFLVCAVLEWVLITLLFIYGFLVFVANEFARYFELPMPCLLCTRIDHLLVNRKPDSYYNDSICEGHKKEISYLAYCHDHNRLADIRKMCEGCLFSFATGKHSDRDTYKSLVGILHKDLEGFVEDINPIHLSLPTLKKDDALEVEKNGINCCSCCAEPLKVKSSYSKGKCSGAYSQAPAPSPRGSFVTLKNEESCNLDLPHIRYTELKFMSGNDSTPEDEDGLSATNSDIQFREDVKAATVPLLSETVDLNDDASKTSNFDRGNKFFGISLTDSPTNSPRWAPKITRKSSLSKLAFASESVEGKLPNEAESDSILHYLTKQVHLDHKSLVALYMELDEERNASAVAANNAMAMITRLQAEKAAVQMEALQYQRMMEEQAEYEEEALKAANELLAKREEEIKILEAELEVFRQKYGCLSEDDFRRCEIGAAEDYREYTSYSPDGAKSESDSFNVGVNEGDINGENRQNNYLALSTQEANGGGTLSAALKDFKVERTNSLGWFKKPDRRNHLSSEKIHFSQSGSDGFEHTNDKTGKQRKAILSRELSLLSNRVKALKADGGFIENAGQKLGKESEGTKLLTEIYQNLWKLRQIVIMPPEENDA